MYKNLYKNLKILKIKTETQKCCETEIQLNNKI